MHSLGLVSITFRGNTAEEIITATKNAGLSCIEWGSDIHAPFDDINKLTRITEFQNKAGLYCCSYGTYFRLGETDISLLQKYIDAAKILGTDILRLWCGTKSSLDYTSEEEEQLFTQCRKAAGIAEKNGVMLCMECHNGTYTDTKQGAIRLMKTVNSPAFRMYWQPNQFVSIEESKQYARLLAPFTRHLHVFNWTEKERFPLSEATELWKEYLSYFEGNHTLLLEFMPDDNINSLNTEAESLKRLIL